MKSLIQGPRYNLTNPPKKLGDFFINIFVYMFYNACVMKLESPGILIGLRPFNERDAVARILTRDYGVLVGMMRGAVVAKKNKPLIGQIGCAVWNARLDSQLGMFHWDAEKNLVAKFMLNPGQLAYINAAFELLVTLLPEREAYPVLYDETIYMLENLAGDAYRVYLGWEISLLRDLGFALDLSHCSGCGATQNLNYLSPRTARAVCDKCAAPYIDRLYKLPVNLGVTGRFLDSVCAQLGVNIPHMRKMLKLD